MNHLGIDAHQKYSEICILSPEGKVLKRQQSPTTEIALGRVFRSRKPARIVFECGPMTPWLYRFLRGWGHEVVVVVNPRRVRLIAESTLQSDKIDVALLALREDRHPLGTPGAPTQAAPTRAGACPPLQAPCCPSPLPIL